MTTSAFDFAPLLRTGLPAPAAAWNGFPKFNFTGGHNDAAQVPVDKLVAAAAAVLKREGPTLATYGLESGPLGYRPLRDFLVAKLARDAGISCKPEEILITSGSLHRPRFSIGPAASASSVSEASNFSHAAAAWFASSSARPSLNSVIAGDSAGGGGGSGV